jgi:hypothetical protein
VGIALNGDWYEARPASDPEETRRNRLAARRALEFTLGWFARPLYQARLAAPPGARRACSARCGGRSRRGRARALRPPPLSGPARARGGAPPSVDTPIELKPHAAWASTPPPNPQTPKPQTPRATTPP